MPIRQRDAKLSLGRKGFREEERSHTFFFLFHGGKKTTCYTYFSHGSENREIGPGLLSRMKRELQLNTSQQVRYLLECPMDEVQLLNILRRKGIL